MINKLRLLFKSDLTGLIGLEHEIDFTPSTGLIIESSIINGKVGTVLYNGKCFIAMMDTVVEPTNPEVQLEYLKNLGWKEYKI